MSEIPEGTIARLRAFARTAPRSASELDDALSCVREVCPDFAFTGSGMSRGATFTLPDGSARELAGRTHGDLLGQAAALLSGMPAAREERRGRGKEGR